MLDLFLGGLQITFQVQQKVGLLDHFQTLFQLVMLFHKIYDGFVCVLQLTLGHTDTAPVNGEIAAAIG